MYYLINFELLSPLSIGNGISELTHHDIIRDADNNPFIPATSITGAFVHFLNKKEQKIFIPQKKDEKILSPYFISDAILTENAGTSIRDGIKLDADKVTIDEKKYNVEILEAGSKFTFRIEVTVRDNDDEKTMENIVSKLIINLEEGNILFGLKSRRGFGKVKINQVYNKVFKNGKDELKNLLKFNKFNPKDYNTYDYTVNMQDYKNEKYDTIEVDLKQLGGLSIKAYKAIKGEVDFEHIKSNGYPIIPGTSWNGLIKKQVRYYDKLLKNKIDSKLIKSQDIEDWFGAPNDKTETTKASSIIFEESRIDSAKTISFTRNKIDRFSGGSADTALFSEEAVFNGNTKLVIKVKKAIDEIREIKNENNEIQKQIIKHENTYILALIALAVKDIENGLIALGGQTSIGRGIFELVDFKKNDESISPQKLISALVDRG